MIRACDFLHLAACAQTTTSNECKNAKIKSAKNLTKKVAAISSERTTKKSFTGGLSGGKIVKTMNNHVAAYIPHWRKIIPKQ
jgi:hypothetical protein